MIEFIESSIDEIQQDAEISTLDKVKAAIFYGILRELRMLNDTVIKKF